MTRHTARAAVLAGAALLVALACQKSETIAPDGSTITLTANPSTVILVSGLQSQPVTILATVRNTIGVPLEGQDVRFTTNSGQLTPTAGLPISTDGLGNATCVLTNATVGPQVTATSGKATANITLSSGTGQVAQIILSPSGTVPFSTCSDTIDFTAEAIGPDGKPVGQTRIFFEFVDPTAAIGTFLPTNGTSDDQGIVTSTLTIGNGSACTSKCQAQSGQNADCSTNIRARDQFGATFSNIVTLNDQVP